MGSDPAKIYTRVYAKLYTVTTQLFVLLLHLQHIWKTSMQLLINYCGIWPSRLVASKWHTGKHIPEALLHPHLIPAFFFLMLAFKGCFLISVIMLL